MINYCPALLGALQGLTQTISAHLVQPAIADI